MGGGVVGVKVGGSRFARDVAVGSSVGGGSGVAVAGSPTSVGSGSSAGWQAASSRVAAIRPIIARATDSPYGNVNLRVLYPTFAQRIVVKRVFHRYNGK